MRIGQACVVHPVTLTGYDEDQGKNKTKVAKRGKIVYIHPKMRFVRVAFEFLSGSIVESFAPEEVKCLGR